MIRYGKESIKKNWLYNFESLPLTDHKQNSDDGDINFWTFAMLGISSTFLIFVGFSIVIMW